MNADSDLTPQNAASNQGIHCFQIVYSFSLGISKSHRMRRLIRVSTVFKYSRLSLSGIRRDSLKHFEISVPRHIRVEKVRKTIN